MISRDINFVTQSTHLPFFTNDDVKIFQKNIPIKLLNAWISFHCKVSLFRYFIYLFNNNAIRTSASGNQTVCHQLDESEWDMTVDGVLSTGVRRWSLFKVTGQVHHWPLRVCDQLRAHTGHYGGYIRTSLAWRWSIVCDVGRCYASVVQLLVTSFLTDNCNDDLHEHVCVLLTVNSPTSAWCPGNTTDVSNVWPMLVQRRRRWANIGQTLGRFDVLAGWSSCIVVYVSLCYDLKRT